MSNLSEMSNLLVQIKINIRHADFVKADQLTTKVLMDNKYPTQPYMKGMLLKGDLKKARNASLKTFPKALLKQIDHDYDNLATSVKNMSTPNQNS